MKYIIWMLIFVVGCEANRLPDTNKKTTPTKQQELSVIGTWQAIDISKPVYEEKVVGSLEQQRAKIKQEKIRLIFDANGTFNFEKINFPTMYRFNKDRLEIQENNREWIAVPFKFMDNGNKIEFLYFIWQRVSDGPQ